MGSIPLNRNFLFRRIVEGEVCNVGAGVDRFIDRNRDVDGVESQNDD
jgi:hypothetical protein